MFHCLVPSDGFAIHLWHMKLVMEGGGGHLLAEKSSSQGRESITEPTALCPAVQVCKCLCFLAAKFR